MTSRTSTRCSSPGRAPLTRPVARFRLSLSPLRFLMPAIAFALLAAAPRPAAAGVAEYFRDRGEDFLDIFRIRYIVPYRAEGYGAKARVTALAQVGYVHLNGSAYGMDRRAIGHNVEKRTEGGVSIFYASRTEMVKVSGNQYLDSDSDWNQAAARGIMRQGGAWDDGRRHPVSIGAEVELGILGIDLGVYPTEAFDFLTGWIFFDIYKDDRSFTDRLPEFDVEAKEARAKEEEEAAKRAAEEAAKESATLEATTPGATLLPEGTEESGMKSEPEALMEESSDPTLGSEFVTPQDVENFKSDEAAPGTETVETPLATEPGQAPAPETAPAPTPETPNPGSQTAPGAPVE